MLEKIIVTAAVAVSAWWLLRLYLKKFKTDSTGGCCGDCHGCGSTKTCGSQSEGKKKKE